VKMKKVGILRRAGEKSRKVERESEKDLNN
jgi:hypothetical protein